MKFILEIYEPDSGRDVLHHIDSDQPFMAISPGSTLDQGAWDTDSEITADGNTLRVTAVRHIITESLHKVLIFTKILPNEAEDATRDCSPV